MRGGVARSAGSQVPVRPRSKRAARLAALAYKRMSKPPRQGRIHLLQPLLVDLSIAADPLGLHRCRRLLVASRARAPSCNPLLRVRLPPADTHLPCRRLSLCRHYGCPRHRRIAVGGACHRCRQLLAVCRAAAKLQPQALPHLGDGGVERLRCEWWGQGGAWHLKASAAAQGSTALAATTAARPPAAACKFTSAACRLHVRGAASSATPLFRTRLKAMPTQL